MTARQEDSVEHALSTLSGLETEKMPDDRLPLFRSRLNKYSWYDPYAGSAAYLGLTGRHGLWIAARDGNFLALCRHPNDPRKMLIFPPVQPDLSLVSAVLSALKNSGVDHQLARWQPTHIERLSRSGATGEDVLDWRYAVYVLNTETVSKRTGHAFRDFRNNVNRVDATRLRAKPLESRERDAVEQIALAWAERASGRLKLENPVEPYHRLLDLFEWLPMRGWLYHWDDVPCAFTMWEETDPVRGIANSFASVVGRGPKGLSEFIHADMCRTLIANGFARVCIGGSERVGLDSFKRKMRPVESITLESVHLPPMTNPS